MDLIRLRRMRVPTVIGTLEEERTRRQEVVIDLELECELSAAGASDNLLDAPDYSALEREVFELVAASRFRLLEKLAAEIAGAVLANPLVHGCRVRLGKPGAPRFAETVEVEIVRRKA